jgi:hypothetical protein
LAVDRFLHGLPETPVCCQYHKSHGFDESSSEESSEDKGLNAYERDPAKRIGEKVSTFLVFPDHAESLIRCKRASINTTTTIIHEMKITKGHRRRLLL